MEVWIAGLVGVVIFAVWFLRGILETNSKNEDPIQIGLAGMLFAASTAEDENEKILAIEGIEDLTFEQNFNSSELTTRMAHACSMVKVTGQYAIYERSKKICDGIVRAWPERYSSQLRK